MFSRIANFLSTARDVGRFKRLIQELGAPVSVHEQLADIENIFAEPGRKRRTRDDALEEFTTLMAQRGGIAAVFRAARAQWAGGQGEASGPVSANAHKRSRAMAGDDLRCRGCPL